MMRLFLVSIGILNVMALIFFLPLLYEEDVSAIDVVDNGRH